MVDDLRLRAGALVLFWLILIQAVRSDLVPGNWVYLWDVALVVAVILTVRLVRQWRAAR